MAGQSVLPREGQIGHDPGHRTPAQHGGHQHRHPERAGVDQRRKGQPFQTDDEDQRETP
jgi:hypothetical protein